MGAAAAAPGGFGNFGGAAPAFGGLGAGAADPDLISATLPVGADSLSSICFSPDSRYVSASSWDGKVYAYENVRDGMGKPAQLKPVAVSPAANFTDGPLLDHEWISPTSIVAVGCGPHPGNRSVKLWDIQANTASVIGQVSGGRALPLGRFCARRRRNAKCLTPAPPPTARSNTRSL